MSRIYKTIENKRSGPGSDFRIDKHYTTNLGRRGLFYFFKMIGLYFAAFLISSSYASACSASFTGDTMVCSGMSVNYLTKPISGHHYRWVVNGGNIVNGQGKDSLWVNWPTPGTNSVELIDSTSSCKDSVTKKIRVGLASATLSAGTYDALGYTTISGRVVKLTDGFQNENSAAWNQYQLNLNKNFDLNFITNQNAFTYAAEGMMFVIQNTSIYAYNGGGQGSDLGYYNASGGSMDQSIGMEEDLSNSGTAYDDSSSSHLNLVIDKYPTPIRAQVNTFAPLSNTVDRKLRITWNRDINLFEIYFEGVKVYSWHNDIVKNIFGGHPDVWFGFTGSTGNHSCTQTFRVDTLIYNQAIINSPSDTFCSGDSLTLTSSQGMSYLWSTGAKTRAIKIVKSGKYSVTVTDSFNCTSTAKSDSIVTVTPVSASFSVASGCVGYSVSITNKTTPTTGVRYKWKFGNGDSATGKLPTYAYKTAGNYTINLSASNGGCTSKTSYPITVYIHPTGIKISQGLPFQGGQLNTGDLTSPDYVCLGDTNTYQFGAPIGYSNSNYGSKWVISSKTFATFSGTVCTDTVFKNPTAKTNASFQFFPGTKFADSVLILTMHVLLIGNCDTVITRFIQVKPEVKSKFLFTDACQGFALSFIDSSTIAKGDSVSNRNWNFGDGSTSTLRNPKHTYSNPGNYYVTLSATSTANCGLPITHTVTQYPEPVSGFKEEGACHNMSSVFTDSSTIISGAIVSHAWNFGNGAGSSLTNPSYVYSKSGPYHVKLVVTSFYGCKDSITKFVRIQPNPVAIFNYKNACVGTPIYFTNKSIDSTTGTKYLWNFGDTVTSVSKLTAHSYIANGTYSAKLSVISKYGCTDTSVLKITPYPEAVPNIIYSGACTKNAVAFGDSDNNDIGATYSWSFGDGDSTVTIADTLSHVYNVDSSYLVFLKIQNGQGCIDSQSKIIMITNYPAASFLSPNVCEGMPLAFTNLTTGTGLRFSWNFGDTTSGKLNYSALQNPSHIYDTAGIYNVTFSVTNPGGCAASITQNANVVAPPIVGKWTYMVHNQTVTFIPGDTTEETYKWYFGTGDSISVKNPVYAYQTKGKYEVKLVEANAPGCSGSYSDSITLTGLGVDPVIGPKNNLNISIFPNPFESKTIVNYILTSISTVNVSVYNMQGKLVAILKNGTFEAGKYRDEFDAVKYNATDGVYLVKMTVNGEVFTGRIVEMK